MISFSGLASGLDSSAIISQLVALERIPINLLEQKKAIENEKLELVGTLKGLVQGLQSKAKGLSTLSDFLKFDVSAGQEGIATFSATGDAQPGSHTISVESLAQADRWAFDGVADPDAQLGTADGQQLQFTVGTTTYDIVVNQADSSLNDIADEINDLAGDDVTASVVNVGTSSAPSYQLVIASDETGEDYRISGIASTVTGLTIDATGPDANGNAQSANNVTVGTNAVAIIDGLTVERESNDFSDVIEGVSIEAVSADPGNPVSFTVEADDAGIKSKVQEFLDAYNEVVDFINEQNTYTEDAGAGGELFGDSLLQSVGSQIKSALFNVPIDTVLNDDIGYSTLSLVGIKQDSSGKLSIDDSVFDEKLAGNLDALADLFVDTDGFDNGGAAVNTAAYYQDTTADSGLAASLDRAIERMFGTFDTGTGTSLSSLFDAKTDVLNSNIKRFDDQIDSKERYLEVFEQNLIQRYAALEELMAGLNAQGASLSSMLSSLTPKNDS